jgi:plastocyanin
MKTLCVALLLAIVTLWPPFLFGKGSRVVRLTKSHLAPKPDAVSQTVTVTVGPGSTLSFSPSTVNITVGDTVQWNWSGFNHTVTSGNCCSADGKFCSPTDLNCPSSSPSNPPATYSHTFTQVGTFPYFCRIHGGAMTGTVNVAPPPVQITGITRPTSDPDTGHFIINGQTVANITVTIKASQDLVHYDPIGTATSDGTGAFHFNDADAATIQPPTRFYIAVYP